MKNKLNSVRAFSLVELSIVILIIGIIIVGVTQSSRLVKVSRLQTARTLTQSSPISSIKGVVLWLESTLEASFSTSEQDEGVPITVWNDTNPQAIKNNLSATVVTSTSDILYKESGINGLPVVNFAGTNTAYFSTTSIATTYNKFSYFLVYKNLDSATTNSRILFSNGTAGTDGFGYKRISSTGNRVQMIGASSADLNTATAMATDSEIVSGVYDGATMEFWLNGDNKVSASKTASTPDITLYVGGTSTANTAWKGYIAEIVIMDGAIKDSDRYEIEKYLSKKWGIAVTQTP